MNYQDQVNNFIVRYNLETDIKSRMLDLISEVGELSKEVLKHTNYGKSNFDAENLTKEWTSELGDVFFSLICIANTTNANLEECLSNSLNKYQKRFENKGDTGSGN